jgi:hypothetical protein
LELKYLKKETKTFFLKALHGLAGTMCRIYSDRYKDKEHQLVYYLIDRDYDERLNILAWTGFTSDDPQSFLNEYCQHHHVAIYENGSMSDEDANLMEKLWLRNKQTFYALFHDSWKAFEVEKAARKRAIAAHKFSTELLLEETAEEIHMDVDNATTANNQTVQELIQAAVTKERKRQENRIRALEKNLATIAKNSKRGAPRAPPIKNNQRNAAADHDTDAKKDDSNGAGTSPFGKAKNKKTNKTGSSRRNMHNKK